MNPRRLRILITAGPTREYIDPVRFISNDSSGKTGFLIAAAARRSGHSVTLVHGPVTLKPPLGVRAVGVTGASDMLAACRQIWPKHDVLIMAAAVADYSVAQPSNAKLKRTAATLKLVLIANPDILATLSAARRPDQIAIGFALEDRAGRRNAESKLARKNLDAIVLNRPTAIGADENQVEILRRDGSWAAWPVMSKRRLAARLVELAEQLAEK